MDQYPKTSRQAAIEMMQWVDARRENPGIISGVSSWGYSTLDKMTGGVQVGELAGLGARPGIGKSAWLNVPIQTIARTFRERGNGELVRGVILEMSTREFLTRQACAMAMLPQGKVREGRISDEERARLADAARELAQLPVEYIDFQTPLPEIARFLRSTRTGKTGWWFVDHLGILPGVNSSANKSTVVAGFMDELTQFAKQIAPGMVVIPLNRNAEGRQDQHPILSDFRDSSQIESNLQLAIGLYRNLKDAARPENRNRPQAGDMEVMKQRNGPLGRIYMLFDAPRTLWYEDDERNSDLDGPPKPQITPEMLATAAKVASAIAEAEREAAEEEMEF
jgi:replicative DNA helicase